MKTHRLLLLLWLGCGLAGVWIVYGFFDFYRNKNVYLTARDPADLLRERSDRAPARAAERQRQGFPQYNVLFDLNVTGVVPPPVDEGPVGPPLPPEDPNRRVAEILRVLATFHDPVDASGARLDLGDGTHYCFVAYVDDKVDSRSDPYLAVGDALPAPYQAIRVKAVLEDKVVFLLEDGQEESLALVVTEPTLDPSTFLKEVAGEGGASTESARSTVAGWPEKTTEVDPNRWKIGTEDLLAFEERQADLVADIQVVPRHARGERQPSGLRVTSIRPGSPLEGKGLETGDVVLSVNGVAVTTKEGVFDYARTHPELRSFTVEIERRGRRLTLQFFLPR